jgi:hypothetical protein
MYRLWNSTLVGDYPNVYSVNIKSRAKMHLPPGLMILQNPEDDEAQVSAENLIAFSDSIGLRFLNAVLFLRQIELYRNIRF